MRWREERWLRPKAALNGRNAPELHQCESQPGLLRHEFPTDGMILECCGCAENRQGGDTHARTCAPKASAHTVWSIALIDRIIHASKQGGIQSMAPILMRCSRINSLNSTSSLSTWDKFRQRQAKLVDLGLIDSSAAEGGQSSRVFIALAYSSLPCIYPTIAWRTSNDFGKSPIVATLSPPDLQDGFKMTSKMTPTYHYVHCYCYGVCNDQKRMHGRVVPDFSRCRIFLFSDRPPVHLSLWF